MYNRNTLDYETFAPYIIDTIKFWYIDVLYL